MSVADNASAACFDIIAGLLEYFGYTGIDLDLCPRYAGCDPPGQNGAKPLFTSISLEGGPYQTHLTGVVLLSHSFQRSRGKRPSKK